MGFTKRMKKGPKASNNLGQRFSSVQVRIKEKNNWSKGHRHQKGIEMWYIANKQGKRVSETKNVKKILIKEEYHKLLLGTEGKQLQNNCNCRLQ